MPHLPCPKRSLPAPHFFTAVSKGRGSPTELRGVAHNVTIFNGRVLFIYASMAEDIVDVHNLETSFAIKVSPVVPPGT